MPSVSYVVTVYNKQRFLPFVIAALQAQTGEFDREYVFVDDGSTDDSVAVIEAAFAGDDRLILVRQANQGPAVATNTGFAHARGDYVKPVDGDDVIAPWATEELLAAMHATDTQMAFGAPRNIGIYRPDDKVADVLAGFTRSAAPARQIDLLPISLRNAHFNPTSWMAARGLVESFGGCDTDFFVQDYSLELRLAAAGPVAEIDFQLFRAPLDPDVRVSANEAQILHDMNGALVNFLVEYADRLPAGLMRLGMKRATGRTWLWAKRHGGGRILSAEFGALLRARLGLLQPDTALRDMLGRTFRETGSVRIPAPPAAAPAAAIPQ